MSTLVEVALGLDTYSGLVEDNFDTVALASNAAGAAFMKPSRFRLWEKPPNHKKENPQKHRNCSNFQGFSLGGGGGI